MYSADVVVRDSNVAAVLTIENTSGMSTPLGHGRQYPHVVHGTFNRPRRWGHPLRAGRECAPDRVLCSGEPPATSNPPDQEAIG